jgi:hypothetical protein
MSLSFASRDFKGSEVDYFDRCVALVRDDCGGRAAGRNEGGAQRFVPADNFVYRSLQRGYANRP